MLLKIVLLGDSSVGKTSLIEQYIKRRFITDFKTTVGTDFFIKHVIIDDMVLTLQIWDTAGQERYQSLGVAYFCGADCCILLYDVTDKRTFRNVENWRLKFLIQANVAEPEKFPFLLIGNKIDLIKNRTVSSEKAEKWCTSKNYNIPYFEVSSKDGVNIDNCFEAIARSALAIKMANFSCPDKSIKLTDDIRSRPKKKCECN